MTEEFGRIQRINALVQAELARLIQQELSDPRLSFVTITEVDVSRDLSYAKIYITTHNDQEIEETLRVLKHASKFLRRQLAKTVELRKMPELHFYLDDTIARSARISKLLKDK